MINIFRSQYFTFDGKRSRDYQISIVRMDSKEAKGIFGTDKKLGLGNYNDIAYIKNIEKEPIREKITLMKLKYGYNEPLPFTRDELDRLNKWLFKDDFRPFISEDNNGVVGYVRFNKGEDSFNGAMQGEINVEIEMNTCHGYSNPLIDHWISNGSKRFTIYNRSNCEDFSYPDIEFQLTDNTTDIEIINKTLGIAMKFTGLEPNDWIYCSNEGLQTVKSKIDKKRNIFKCFKSRQWLKLAYGRNVIEIKGKAEVKIIQQFPMALK